MATHDPRKLVASPADLRTRCLPAVVVAGVGGGVGVVVIAVVVVVVVVGVVGKCVDSSSP